MICSKCHTKSDEGNFCAVCGGRMVKEVATPQPSPTEKTNYSKEIYSHTSRLINSNLKTDRVPTNTADNNPSKIKAITFTPPPNAPANNMQPLQANPSRISDTMPNRNPNAPLTHPVSSVPPRQVNNILTNAPETVSRKKGKLKIKIIIWILIIIITMSLAVVSAYLVAKDKIPWLSTIGETQSGNTKYKVPQNPETSIIEEEPTAPDTSEEQE